MHQNLGMWWKLVKYDPAKKIEQINLNPRYRGRESSGESTF